MMEFWRKIRNCKKPSNEKKVKVSGFSLTKKHTDDRRSNAVDLRESAGAQSAKICGKYFFYSNTLIT